MPSVLRFFVLPRGYATAALVALPCFGLLWTPLLSAQPSHGSPGLDSGHEPCPGAMVNIEGAFCIDAFEAHLVLADGRVHPFFEEPKDQDYRAVSQRDVYPQAHISRQQASVACRKAGKRLCSSDEWQKACRGPEPTAYPYGVKHREGYCNDRAVAPLPILFGYDRFAYDPYTMNDARLNRVPGTLARAGRFGRCTNTYGVYDLVGNLHEWVADASGVLRGGYYLDVENLGVGCEYRAVGHAPEYRDYSTGFRCCTDTR